MTLLCHYFATAMWFIWHNYVNWIWQSMWCVWQSYCKYDIIMWIRINNLCDELTNFVIWFTKLCQSLTKTLSSVDKVCHPIDKTLWEWHMSAIIMSLIWQSLPSHMTKFVILSQTLSFIAIERSKSDIILCEIMTKFVVFLTLKGPNDKVGPRDALI